MKSRQLQIAASGLQVTDFVDYRLYLEEIYKRVKNDDESMTYLKYAQLLGFSESNVIWMVVKGRRKLTRLTSSRIVHALALNGLERKYFNAMVLYINERIVSKKDSLFAKLMEIKHLALSDGSDQLALEYFSEWYHPVIREMSREGNLSTNSEDLISNIRPRILPKEIDASIKLLDRLGLIEISEDKATFSYKGENIVPSRRINRHASIRFHHAMMNMAKNSLVNVPDSLCEYNGLTLSFSDELVPKAKEIIRNACMALLDLEALDQRHRDVFQVNIQMFPFTRKER